MTDIPAITKAPISDDEFWETIRRAALTVVTAIERRQGVPLTTELAKAGRRMLREEAYKDGQRVTCDRS